MIINPHHIGQRALLAILIVLCASANATKSYDPPVMVKARLGFEQAAHPKLLMTSLSRPSFQHQTNARGLRLDLEVSGEPSFSSSSMKGVHYYGGFVATRLILNPRGMPRTATHGWYSYY